MPSGRGPSGDLPLHFQMIMLPLQRTARPRPPESGNQQVHAAPLFCLTVAKGGISEAPAGGNTWRILVKNVSIYRSRHTNPARDHRECILALIRHKSQCTCGAPQCRANNNVNAYVSSQPMLPAAFPMEDEHHLPLHTELQHFPILP